MKLIVGLGNSGLIYKNTKHNAGFWVAESIAQKLEVSLNKRAFNSQFGQGNYKGQAFIIAKPLTYMNKSGKAVKNLIDYFKIPLENLLIIFDDVDLKLGAVRLRLSGSAGSHNGMRSVIEYLRDNKVARMRLGIKTEASYKDLSGYVLSGFRTKEDAAVSREMVETAKEAGLCWIENGIDSAMNRFNKKGGNF